MRNERTSARVAKIAGRILAEKIPARAEVFIKWNPRIGMPQMVMVSGSEINAVCASALTQAPNVSRTMDRALRRSAKLVAKGKRRTRRE